MVKVDVKKHRDKAGGHYHAMFDEVDDKYVSVGFTSKAKKGKNSTNYKCENDVLGDGKQSYLRRQATVDDKNMYFGFWQGNFTEKDYTQAKTYAERAKQKYLANKKRNDVPNTQRASARLHSKSSFLDNSLPKRQRVVKRKKPTK